MSKKKFILLFIFTNLFLFNCKKENTIDNTAPQYMADLLTKDTLQFESYIFNWNSTSPDTLYTRGSQRNRLNFDTAWFKFDSNGTYKGYLSEGYNYAANWQLLEKGSKLRLWNSTFDNQYNLLKISKDTIEWLDVKMDSLFYRFIPK